MLRFVCLALLVSLVSARIPFKDCGNHELKSLEVSSCDSAPCTLHKGNEVTITAVFVANQDTNKAEIQIMAKMGELEAQIPGIDTNACNGHVTCPMKKGETYTLTYKVPIPASTPTVEADVSAKLIGDHGVIGCGSIRGSIRD